MPNERKKTMGKVQILAVLTMDGCHSSELYGKAYEDLRLDRCDIDKIRENALYHVTPDYSISILYSLVMTAVWVSIAVNRLLS